jgi:UDP-N-acetylglucosamine acyltransferase
MSQTIDSHAIVNPKAQIGDNVTIGPFTVVEENVTIGDNTVIGPHVLISCGSRIGADCVVHHGAAVGGPPQDLKYRNEKTELIVGDRTIIREFTTLHRGTTAHWKTVIGSDTFIMAYAHVSHDSSIGSHCIIAGSVTMGGHVEIEDWAIIGGLTAIHQFVKIGSHAMVGGNTGVGKDVPPYVMAANEPFRFEGLNIIGLRRRGFTPDVIDALKAAYGILYSGKYNVSVAVEHIRQEVPQIPEVVNVIEFITKKSTRGVIPGPWNARTAGS